LVVGNVRFAADHWQATNARKKADGRSFANKTTSRITNGQMKILAGWSKIDAAFSISFGGHQR
jgi:hypothetical protein